MTAVQILGYAAAATTVATGLVSESVDADLHGILSMTQIEILGSAIALSGLFLYRQRGFWPPLAWLALTTEIMVLAFGFLFHTFPMEWVAIALVLAYVGLLALNTWSAFRARRPRALRPHRLVTLCERRARKYGPLRDGELEQNPALGTEVAQAMG